jgi:hypothetical protein
LDLNQLIEVDAYTTLPRKSPRRRINIDKTPPKTLTPRTKATISPNVSGQKAAQKRRRQKKGELKRREKSDERIAAQNMAFQLEIQKLKAQLKSGPGGSST